MKVNWIRYPTNRPVKQGDYWVCRENAHGRKIVELAHYEYSKPECIFTTWDMGSVDSEVTHFAQYEVPELPI